jgi:lipooligosaccharide transport system ATP-binding protein
MDHGRIIAEGTPRELIERHIEPHVVEAFGEGIRDWARSQASRFASRVELTGETAFCYAGDARPLLASLEAQRSLRFLHRPANLEDVFLKLTGRELRE